MDLALNIQQNDAFSYVNLQKIAGTATYVPSTLGQMGLFEPEPIVGKIVHFYEEDSTIRLVPTTERGTPDTRLIPDGGRLRAVVTPRLGQITSVRAEELLGIANEALPQIVQVRNAVQLLTKRTTKMKTNQEATKELHRFGALQGKVLDADGTRVIADFYDLFDIAQPAIIDVDFPNIPEAELLMFFQDTFLRPIMTYLEIRGRAAPNAYLAAIVGDGFWRKLMTHPGFRKIYELQLQAQAVARTQNPLVQPNMWNTVDFAGVRWMNYRPSVGLSTEIAVPTMEARFFPVGAPDVFKVYWGSGEKLEDVTQPGRPEYLYVEPDKRNHPEFIDAILRSYGLYACLLPGALARARVKP